MAREYRTGRGGLPGNDDAGTMSAWFVWSSIGLYPVAGQDIYYIGSPLFTRSEMDVGAGRRFVVEAPRASATRRYVVSARLDGRRLERAWLRHAEIARGGRLELVMGERPSSWGGRQAPPSMTTFHTPDGCERTSDAR